MSDPAIIFLNSHRAKSGTVLGHRLPPGYVLACKFFDCGIIDRSESLELGFPAKVLDPIPAYDAAFSLSFAEVCKAVATDVADRARAEDRRIKLLWSGGIDSTVALISLLKVLPEEEHHRLHLLLTMVSIDEYPRFFREHILRRLSFELISPPVTKYFGSHELIVTGEHGDQLFGSDKLLPLIRNGLCYEPYHEVLPLVAMNKFGRVGKVDRLVEYLEPLLAACPVPLRTAFDLYWWFNFSIKWQQVSLRLPVFTFDPQVKGLVGRFHHFFRDARFQSWSFTNYPNRAADSLADYKSVAKRVIFDYTGDGDYLDTKTKEPSLKHVIVDRSRQGDERYRVCMTEDYRPIVETFHKQFRNQNITE